MPFFITLEAEIIKAELAGKSVIIEMDSNSKLGAEYIKNDPHVMSPNGRILARILERHALIVANGSERCVGLITRERNTKDNIERSVIDFIILSSDLVQRVVNMQIDERRQHA